MAELMYGTKEKAFDLKDNYKVALLYQRQRDFLEFEHPQRDLRRFLAFWFFPITRRSWRESKHFGRIRRFFASLFLTLWVSLVITVMWGPLIENLAGLAPEHWFTRLFRGDPLFFQVAFLALFHRTFIQWICFRRAERNFRLILRHSVVFYAATFLLHLLTIRFFFYS